MVFTRMCGAFIFARKLCDIGCLESSLSTLESTCRWRAAKGFLNFSFIQRKRFAPIPVA